MKIHDISMNIYENMTVYKNKDVKKPKLSIVQDHKSGSAYESKINMEMHTGTHIDSPLHMIDGGHTIDKYDLSRFITKCKVLDFTNVKDKIVAEDLKGKNINKGDFILLKTKNSDSNEFDFKFVFLEKSGAEYLKNIEISGVGIDSLGIERDQPDHKTHKILLNNDVIIMEGLRLKEVEEGEYKLVALPLKIDGVEAAPTRAVLIEDMI